MNGYVRTSSVSEGFILFAGKPQAMEKDSEFSRDGNRGSFLGVLSASFGDRLAVTS